MLSGSYEFLVQDRVLRPLFLNFPDLGSRAMSLFWRHGYGEATAGICDEPTKHFVAL